MILLGELTGQEWVLIITAIGSAILVPIALQITQMILTYLRDRDSKARDEHTGKKVDAFKDETCRVAEEVKHDLHKLTADQNKSLEVIKQDVSDIKNS